MVPLRERLGRENPVVSLRTKNLQTWVTSILVKNGIQLQVEETQKIVAQMKWRFIFTGHRSQGLPDRQHSSRVSRNPQSFCLPALLYLELDSMLKVTKGHWSASHHVYIPGRMKKEKNIKGTHWLLGCFPGRPAQQLMLISHQPSLFVWKWEMKSLGCSPGHFERALAQHPTHFLLPYLGY